MNQEELIKKTVESVLNGCTLLHDMNLKTALAIIEKVEIKAAEMGVNAVVAVSNKAGHPIAVHCMDDAFMGSFDVALHKTYTCVAFKRSTEELGKLCQPGGPLYGIQYTNEGKMVVFGGGEPLFIGDKMIGALGVSGGTAEEDSFLAAYGKDILKEVLSCR